MQNNILVNFILFILKNKCCKKNVSLQLSNDSIELQFGNSDFIKSKPMNAYYTSTDLLRSKLRTKVSNAYHRKCKR
jgi:hypothetical protein